MPKLLICIVLGHKKDGPRHKMLPEYVKCSRCGDWVID